jgi:hypothetical protein
VDSPRLIRLPSVPGDTAAGVLEELYGAIELVASGTARRIVLAAFPGIEDVAAAALARAQAAGVAFSLSRNDDAVTVHIGPRQA